MIAKKNDSKPLPRDIGNQYFYVSSALSEIVSELKKINERLDKLDKHINWIERVVPNLKKKFKLW